MEDRNDYNSDKPIEVSKVQLPNGQIFNLKDTELRKQIKEFLGDLVGEDNDE